MAETKDVEKAVEITVTEPKKDQPLFTCIRVNHKNRDCTKIKVTTPKGNIFFVNNPKQEFQHVINECMSIYKTYTLCCIMWGHYHGHIRSGSLFDFTSQTIHNFHFYEIGSVLNAIYHKFLQQVFDFDRDCEFQALRVRVDKFEWFLMSRPTLVEEWNEFAKECTNEVRSPTKK